MIDLGVVRPGSTIRIPFSTFDKDDGSSITMTNFAVGDILIYKDGSTTQRASTSGFTATTDFDSVDAGIGKHLAVIDLSDNTTSGFYAAGSEYLVAIGAVTVDAVTTGGWIARFSIGYPGELFSTTIATLSSQTSFTLTTGPAEDDALNGLTVVIHDIASAVQCARATVSDYTGSTKTVTLLAGATFTVAAGDNISILSTADATTALTSIAAILGMVNSLFTKTGTAAAGGGSTITLDSGASATNDLYKYQQVVLVTGTGAGQSRWISGYVGATKVATVDRAWTTNPDATTTFVITPFSLLTGAQVPTSNEHADALLARNIEGGSSSGRIVSEALYPLRNKWTNASGAYTVYKTNDSTVSWTSTLSTGTADDITGSDPA